MKIISIIILFIFQSTLAHSSEYLRIGLSSLEEVQGELIEVYEDRWFYEPQRPQTKKYHLLFNLKKGRPHFRLIDNENIEYREVTKTAPSLYKKYLFENDLFFKNHLVKEAHILTGNHGHHKFEKMFGNFAWDIGIIDEQGSQFDNNGENLSDFYVFDKEVISPLNGLVVGKVGNQPDNPTDLSLSQDLSNKVNNYLTIKVKGDLYLSIVHFKQNSIKVEVGSNISVGQSLGVVGNSGVSYLPHLHYTLYAYIKEYDRFISVPGFFAD